MTSEILTISLGFVNCYLVKTDAGFVLVDTGMRSGRADLEKALANAGCQLGNLKLIVITHGDIDHTDNCVYLREKYQTRIAMHQNDARHFFARLHFRNSKPGKNAVRFSLE